MKVGISNYVASAALAVIGGAAALYTYISQTFNPPTGFDLLMLAALACLVISIVLGGRGADDATAAVANDTWTMSSSGRAFELQAVLTLLGLILVLIATFVGAMSDRRESSVEARVERLEKQVRHLQVEQRGQGAEAPAPEPGPGGSPLGRGRGSDSG
jgi:amino acid transporter